MKHLFEDFNFRAKNLARIDQANTIIAEYQASGFTLTLRQLYYQFVARALISNTQREYKNLGVTLSKARLAGLVDWTTIEDRTRNLQANTHFDGVSGILEAASQTHCLDLWLDQPVAVEVWIEKEALTGVIANVCHELDVPYFACRGYVSQSEQWQAGQRACRRMTRSQETIILHLGDHDPSGVDMTRDNETRLDLFAGGGCTGVHRIALNYDQVQEYNPPPNPAKLTDTRAPGYIHRYGNESWELDALDPHVIEQLIRDHVDEYRDIELFDARLALQEQQRNQLIEVAESFAGEQS
jgi:hypothetical protein